LKVVSVTVTGWDMWVSWLVGQPLAHRTQLAASVEAGFLAGVDAGSDVVEVFSDFAVSVLVPVAALFESPPSDVIDDEDAPRLSVL
jgi:hypothetical protein